MNTGTGTWCFPLSRLRKTFARLHTICRDCRCDILSDIELDRLEQDLGRLKCTEWQVLHQWFDFALECTFSVNLIQFEIQCGAGCWWFAIRSKFPGPWTVPKDPTCQPTCWWIYWLQLARGKGQGLEPRVLEHLWIFGIFAMQLLQRLSVKFWFLILKSLKCMKCRAQVSSWVRPRIPCPDKSLASQSQLSIICW